jgi:rhamnulokinase
MTESTNYVAFDLTPRGGQVMLGRLDSRKLALEQVHRFPITPVRISGSYRWDVLQIFCELKAGLNKLAEANIPVAALSVDSWGVDYVLVQKHQPLLGAPYHYSDPRTSDLYTRALMQATPEVLFTKTGVQPQASNTLFQMLSEIQNNPSIIESADNFLNIADYFNYLFSGVAFAEQTLASTTQLFDPSYRDWSNELIHLFQLPARLFPKLIKPGTILGPLHADISDEIPSQKNVKVVASCSHDNAASVAAVPATSDDWVFLNSGIWSFIGMELHSPLTDATALKHKFTNQAGFGKTTLFSKNISGLWPLQQCKIFWEGEGESYSAKQLSDLAQQADGLVSLINPNDPRFWTAEDMPQKIREYCEETEQPAPKTPGAIVRTVLESLALLYRKEIEGIENVTHRRVRTLHIIGSGSRNTLLNQFAADATGRHVIAGPVEPAATGNVLVQAIALGQLESLEELRATVKSSFPIQTYRPFISSAWESAYQRFKKLEQAG